MAKVSLAWQTLGKNLPLRAVIFDARCIQRSADEAAAPGALKRRISNLDFRRPEQLVAQGKVKDMLRTEIREELERRGISPVGKPWEIQARLEEAINAEAGGGAVNAEAGGGDAAASNEESSPPPPPPPPKAASSLGPASSAEEKRAMYAAKLRNRTGGFMLADGTIIAAKKDSVLSTGATALRRDERPDDPSMSWHLQPHTRELLTYCDMRGMARVLLPVGVETDEAGITQAANFSRSLKVPEFAHVLSVDEMEATRRGEPSAIVRACSALGLPKSSNIMIVSDQSAVLRAAKAARSFSCFFVKRLPGAPKSLPADFTAQDMRGLQDAIEELNGVTFRDAETEIRTKFGVNVT